MSEWITVEQALQTILGSAIALGEEEVALSASKRRILARAISSPIDLPPFDNSAMDGFAFLHSETWKDPLEIVGTSSAGGPFHGSIQPNQAIRIMTGAPVPDICDTVVPIELTSEENNHLWLNEAIAKGSHIRKKSTYLSKGKPALDAHIEIDPGAISVLSSFGYSTVPLVRRPIVAILTTGDELVPIDQEPGEGQIRNSNAHMIEALVEEAGCVAKRYAITPDRKQAVQDNFKKAIQEADIVLSIGGVSMGDFDFVRETILELTNSNSFWKVQIKPGKPLTYGRSGNTHLIGLPGNPMSSFVSFHVFAKPLIDRLLGRSLAPHIANILCADSYKSTPRREEYFAGRVELIDGKEHFVNISGQKNSSGNPCGMTGCTHFAISPVGENMLEKGTYVQVLTL